MLLGSNDISDLLSDVPTNDPKREMYRGKTALIHPAWDSNNLKGDVAMAQLDIPACNLTFSSI